MHRVFDVFHHLGSHVHHLRRFLGRRAHLVMIGVIATSLLHEGGGPADWAFLVLAILCEVPA